MFPFSHFRRPKNFHEIAGLRLFEILKVPAESELMDKSCRARSHWRSSGPRFLTVALAANN